jgi:hypothetical protein
MMKSIAVNHYKSDPRSYYTYLGKAKVDKIVYQGTEDPGLMLLDVVFKTTLDDSQTAKFLIRLETPNEDVRDLIVGLAKKYNDPELHPCMDDSFHEAVTGRSLGERWRGKTK